MFLALRDAGHPLKAVHRHFEVFVLAVGAHDRVDQLPDRFNGRALPDAYPRRVIVRRATNGEFKIRRESLLQSLSLDLLKSGGIVDVMKWQ